MSEKANGLPIWLRAIALLVGTLGMPAFLLLWLLGAFQPFMPSPVTAALKEHDDRMGRLQQLICAGIWRDDPGTQRECWK